MKAAGNEKPTDTVRKAKSFISAVLYLVGAALAYRQVVNRRYGRPLRILSAHRVIDEAGPLSARDRDDLARGCLTLSEFIERVQHITLHYTPCSLIECVRALETGVEMPENAVVLTFDDGYRDVFEHAWPVLREAGVPFTVFLTTGFVDRDDAMLTAAQVRRMAEEGQDLISWGAHGVTHRPLTDLQPAEVEREVAESRGQVAALAGWPVEVFCYPDGKYDDDLKTMVAQMGFLGACATGRALNYPPIDRYALKRIPFESEPIGRFAFRLAGWK